MSTKAIASLVFILAAAAFAMRADAAGSTYNLRIKGALLNRFGGTCGSALADTYDTFCPSGACSCLQYDDPDKNTFSGNVTGGKGKAGFVTVHFTFDGGDHTGINGKGLGCAPVFGEIQLQGKKDAETISFAGSFCDPQTNPNAATAKQKMAGGWSIKSSTNNVKAFGSFTGSFGFNTISFSMNLQGRIHQ